MMYNTFYCRGCATVDFAYGIRECNSIAYLHCKNVAFHHMLSFFPTSAEEDDHFPFFQNEKVHFVLVPCVIIPFLTANEYVSYYTVSE